LAAFSAPNYSDNATFYKGIGVANDASPLLGVREAAAELGRSVALIRRMCAAGRLRAQKVGKTWVIAPDDLSAFQALDRPRGRPRRPRRR